MSRINNTATADRSAAMAADRRQRSNVRLETPTIPGPDARRPRLLLKLKLKMPPPLPSQKGMGKKGRDRQSRSRNGTPNLVGSHTADSGYLEFPVAHFQTDDEIFENHAGSISSSKELDALLERLNKLVDTVETRGTLCDRGMRMAVELHKNRLEDIESNRRDEERKERLKRDAADEEERGRNKKANKIKKRKDTSTAREERPLTHGAHGLAPQDGSHPGKEITLFHSVFQKILRRPEQHWSYRQIFVAVARGNYRLRTSRLFKISFYGTLWRNVTG